MSPHEGSRPNTRQGIMSASSRASADRTSSLGSRDTDTPFLQCRNLVTVNSASKQRQTGLFIVTSAKSRTSFNPSRAPASSVTDLKPSQVEFDESQAFITKGWVLMNHICLSLC